MAGSVEFNFYGTDSFGFGGLLIGRQRSIDSDSAAKGDRDKRSVSADHRQARAWPANEKTLDGGPLGACLAKRPMRNEIEFDGVWEESQDAASQMMLSFGISFLAIFLILVIQHSIPASECPRTINRPPGKTLAETALSSRLRY